MKLIGTQTHTRTKRERERGGGEEKEEKCKTRNMKLDIIPIKVTNQSTKMRKMYFWHGYLLLVLVKIIKSNAKSKNLSHFLCIWMHDFFCLFYSFIVFLFLDFVSFIAIIAVSSFLFYFWIKEETLPKLFTETNGIWYLVYHNTH